MIVSNTKANIYINSLLQYTSDYKDNIEAIIIFGSQARNNANNHSDVDILIVLKSLNKTFIEDLISRLRFLEIEFNYSRKPTNPIELFLNYLNIATGMFRSWFICTKEDLINGNFSKITSTNKLLVKIFVPAKLILFNIKKDGKVIFGDINFVKQLPVTLKPKNQPFRSFFLNEIIALGGLILAPLTKLGQKYSIESIKWSMFLIENSNLKEKKFGLKLRNRIEFYKSVKVSNRNNPFLSIIAPFLVLELHMLVLKHH